MLMLVEDAMFIEEYSEMYGGGATLGKGTACDPNSSKCGPTLPPVANTGKTAAAAVSKKSKESKEIR